MKMQRYYAKSSHETAILSKTEVSNTRLIPQKKCHDANQNEFEVDKTYQ